MESRLELSEFLQKRSGVGRILEWLLRKMERSCMELEWDFRKIEWSWPELPISGSRMKKTFK